MLSKVIFSLLGVLALGLATSGVASDKPNIVLINMDNFGYGELGVYGGGITRGGATPRIDKLAGEGLRLTNFNVEAQCTPSRAALMTGRYAKRSGNASVPWQTGLYGLPQSEVTMAEMLADQGYATGIFGKWHLGHTPGRFPTDQGFDEWYGIPNSTDEAYWPAQAQFNEVMAQGTVPYLEAEYIYKGRRGSAPQKVKIYDIPARREIDREITDHTKAFIERQAKSGRSFFAYVPYTLTHMPVLPSAVFEGKSGNGHWGDVLMQIDAYVGELIDTLDQLDIADNTIFIFTADNGPEMLPENHGWSGPWSGSYFTAKEGSLRVPFIMRWPDRVPGGRVSNEIVHQMDLFTTLAEITGSQVPGDRLIDGVDQRDFFFGKNQQSARDGFVVYVGEEIFGVKWRNWKMLTKEFDDARGTGRIVEYGVPRFYNLYNDPKEAYAITMKFPEHLWVRWPMAQILREHLDSLAKEPPLKAGTPDPGG
jgi:arylsulfatase